MRMNIDRTGCKRWLIACAVLAAGIQSALAQQTASVPRPRHTIDMTPVKPESVGFSTARLERLHALMQQAVDRRQIAGAVTILARHGRIVEFRTYGYRDLASGKPMTRDTIFRDYSMTKPITGVAMMILYEQAKWQPSDKVSTYIPEFSHLKVYAGLNGEGKMMVGDPVHSPTMLELMTHTAGFTYGNGHSPVDKMYGDLKVRDSRTLQEMIDRLAQIPLAYQPGQAWVYSLSMDIQGYIVEKLSGQSLPDFMREQIFKPLGMKDTDFYVPAEKRSRFSPNYFYDSKSGELKESALENGFPQDYAEQPTKPSGGGGL